MLLIWQFLCQVRQPELAAFINESLRLMPWWFISRVLMWIIEREYSRRRGVLLEYLCQAFCPSLSESSNGRGLGVGWQGSVSDLAPTCLCDFRPVGSEGVGLTGHHMILSSRETFPGSEWMPLAVSSQFFVCAHLSYNQSVSTARVQAL